VILSVNRQNFPEMVFGREEHHVGFLISGSLGESVSRGGTRRKGLSGRGGVREMFVVQFGVVVRETDNIG
jgi:hypothetical protein